MTTDPLRVLVVDDDAAIRQTLRQVLENGGMATLEAIDGTGALAAIRGMAPDLMLLDIRLPDLDGAEVLRRTRHIAPDLPVIILTGHGSIEDAVERVKEGAFWYLTKPCSQREILAVVGKASRELRRSRAQQEPLQARFSLLEMMGNGAKIVALAQEIARVAPTDFSVVIVGETGTGKELVARAIHIQSRRSEAEFVAIDSGAIPESLIENELFGHERGAYTGADRAQPGKLELASGGTLFLDEIGNLPLAMQAKLLRVLQEKRCFRIAGTAAISVDVRVVVATNQPLNVLSPASTFRADLYHRLSEYVIQVPALRDRKEDVPFLSNRFLQATNDELGKQVQGFAPAALDQLMAYDWPGNVRELRNWVRRAVLIADETIEPGHLPTAGVHAHLPETPDPAGANQISLKEILRQQTEAVERRVLRQALEAAKGNKAKAARLLGFDRKTLYRKIERFNIPKKHE